VTRIFYLVIGFAALGLGTIGILVPLLPTVPFMILAAFCFARSSPALERRIVEHPRVKPHISAWRERGAISRKGKTAAMVAFGASALLGVLLLSFPAMLLPLIAALVGGTWILSRPTA
jgi:uncharacterized membrane protein YbaN (DUF454 family)